MNSQHFRHEFRVLPDDSRVSTKIWWKLSGTSAAVETFVNRYINGGSAAVKGGKDLGFSLNESNGYDKDSSNGNNLHLKQQYIYCVQLLFKI